MAQKSTSLRQIELLFEFLSKHEDLAFGRARTKEGRNLAHQLWAEVTDILNMVAGGSKRTAKEWSTYYSDFKCRLKKKVRDYRNGESLPPFGVEAKFAALLFPEDLSSSLSVSHSTVDDNDIEKPSTPNETKVVYTMQDFTNKTFKPSSSPNETEVVYLDNMQDFTNNTLETQPQQPSTPRRPRQQRHRETRDGKDELESTLAEMEMARIRSDMERNDIERQKLTIEREKVAAINNLANAAWALVTKFTEVKSRKRSRPSSDGEDDIY